MKIVYGHTDSIYCDCESIEHAQSVVDELNEHVREKFPNVFSLEEHPVTIEFEKWFSSLLVGCTKNRNAGLISWKDGSLLQDQEFVMTGFTAKRVSETPLAKKTQMEILTMCVEGKSYEDIVSYSNHIYNETLHGKTPINSLIKRSRYKEERFLVKCKNCTRHSNLKDLMIKSCCNQPILTTLKDKRTSVKEGIEGILFYDWIKKKYALNNYSEIGDSYCYLKVKSNRTYNHPTKQEITQTNYVSAPTEKELLEILKHQNSFGECQIDYQFYASSIWKKAQPVFNAMGWDSNPITRDRNQKTLEEWFNE